ncbi:hypothetical protein Z968_06500 [Clostridium novyi A str. 4552]|uniref:Uncharacterized protein n=1 Tax=Clostridium novyi A str. 4552 TaxID=1444289 RepID=A0A0A0I4S4_CLONO|nr:hypothetical protein Z968_06500 [Clostridium novyi A str. 4552]
MLEKIKKYVNGNFYKDIKYDGNMKDEKLNNLITNENINIAQFVSFDPDLNLEPRFIHINNFKYKKNMTKEDVLKELILSAGSRTVNIRSFSPKVMKGNRLVIGKGIEDLDKILNIIKDNSLEGKYSIVNENIDINDGGVSGVILGDVIEFSPEDTPKCVEKDGVCSLPKDIGFKVLHNVYGFYPNINFEPNHRVEFSIHPSRQGIKREHTIIWEYEHYENIEYEIKISWPNKFSRFIGDKVFGLLIAEALGIKVPKTTVISRKVAPFSFGIETGLEEKWIRTCPIIKEPGKYYTGMNWIDPFELMNKEETKGKGEVNIASIICQEAVEPLYSGGAIIKEKEEDDLIEGVLGRGDNFMVGSQNKEELPREIIMKVQELNNKLRNNYGKIGEVTIEWVYDGKDVWVVQLNQLKRNDNNLDRSVIVNGNPLYYEDFFVSEGLDVLRKKIETVKGKNIGIKLVGNIGITSHFGDLLRLANIPSILKRID